MCTLERRTWLAGRFKCELRRGAGPFIDKIGNEAGKMRACLAQEAAALLTIEPALVAAATDTIPPKLTQQAR